MSEWTGFDGRHAWMESSTPLGGTGVLRCHEQISRTYWSSEDDWMFGNH